MNAGLKFLLAKGPTAVLRRLRRRLRGARGIATLVGTLFLIFFLVAPQLMRFAMGRDLEQLAELAPTLRLLAPPAVMLLLLTTAASGGLQFKPAEIQFLFPAPVGRRELLVYNALTKLQVQLLSGLWIALFVLAYARLWYAAIVACCLTLAFWQLAAQAIGLWLATLEQRFGARLRRAVMLTAVGLLVAAGFAAYARVPDGAGLLETFETVAGWAPIQVIALIARPFVEIYLAQTFVAFVIWVVVSVALLAALIGVITAFDLAYAESAIERSQKIQRALERIRSGGSPFAGRGPKRGGLHVPRLPYWSGAGPVAWRQLQEMTRNFRSALMMGAFMFLFLAMFLLMPRFAAPEGVTASGMPAPVALALLALIMPLIGMHTAFDFRRDLGRMSVLKSWPVRGWALACGQMIPTVLLITFWELIAIIVIMAFSPQADWMLIAAILPGLIPLNACLVGIDNILFLLLPYRVAPRDPGRMPFMPRLMLVMFLKLLILLLLVVIAAIPAALVWMTLESVIAAGLAVAVLLTLFAGLAVMGVAAAFRAFDVSRDIPD